MSDIPYGSADRPVRLDPFTRIISVAWPSDAIIVLELEGEISNFMRIFSQDISHDFPTYVNGGIEGGTADDGWGSYYPFEVLTFGLPNSRMIPPSIVGYSYPSFQDGDILNPVGPLFKEGTDVMTNNYQDWHAISFINISKETGQWEASRAFTSYSVQLAVVYDHRNNGEEAVRNFYSPKVGNQPTHNAIGGAIVWKQEEIEFATGNKIKAYTGFDVKSSWPIVCDYYGQPTADGGVNNEHANWTHSPHVLICIDDDGVPVPGTLAPDDSGIHENSPLCIKEWDWTSNLSDFSRPGGALAPNSCMVWATQKDHPPVNYSLRKGVWLLNMGKMSDGKKYLKTFRVINSLGAPLKWKISIYPTGTYFRVDGASVTLVALQEDLTTSVPAKKTFDGTIEQANYTQNFSVSGPVSETNFDPAAPFPASAPRITF